MSEVIDGRQFYPQVVLVEADMEATSAIKYRAYNAAAAMMTSSNTMWTFGMSPNNSKLFHWQTSGADEMPNVTCW
jgi:hypothetical protein